MKPEEIDKPEKLRPRFFLLGALLVLFFACLWWLMVREAFRIAPIEIRWNDIYLSWIEKRGPHFVVSHAIALFILPIAMFLFLFYRKTHAFQKSRTRPLHWLYLTIVALTGLLVCLLCWDLSSFLRRSLRLPSLLLQRPGALHPMHRAPPLRHLSLPVQKTSKDLLRTVSNRYRNFVKSCPPSKNQPQPHARARSKPLRAIRIRRVHLPAQQRCQRRRRRSTGMDRQNLRFAAA
jgi:hypothetical protein